MNWRIALAPVIRPFMHAYWRLRRGTTLGVRGIVEREDGCIVLVEHTYIRGWHLPGGGVESGETADFAMRRELEEEAGVCAGGDLRLVAAYANHKHFSGDHVLLYRVSDWKEVATDHDGEISQVAWFHPDALPDEVSPATQRRIREFFGGEPVSDVW